MTIRRAHYHRSVQSITGAFARGASVAICELGSEVPIAAPLYSAALGDGTINNPFLAQRGIIDFYLDQPRNVCVRVVFGGVPFVVDDEPVLPPADLLLRLNPDDPEQNLLTVGEGDVRYVQIGSIESGAYDGGSLDD